MKSQKILRRCFCSVSTSIVFQEKGGAFSGIFKKSPRLADGPPTEDVRSGFSVILSPSSHPFKNLEH